MDSQSGRAQQKIDFVNMKKYTIVLLFVLINFSCNRTKGQSNLISCNSVAELINSQDINLIDVRTPDEFQSGHIVGAQNIDFYDPNFQKKINQLDKSIPIVLYCRSGKRSARCAAKISDDGFKIIYDLEGGIVEWTLAGHEVIN